MTLNEIARIIEGVLFVAGEGVVSDIFKNKYELSDKEMRKVIDIIKTRFDEKSGVNLIEYKGKLQLCSNPSIVDEISEIINPIREKALSRTALETVAIIAYKQPITRLEIENIRGGVSSDYALQLLEKNNLIEVVGRKDAVGKPLLYGTTDTFLRRFGIKSLDDLPNYQELLSRIRIIHTNTDSLYREFDVPTDSLISEQEEVNNAETNSFNHLETENSNDNE